MRSSATEKKTLDQKGLVSLVEVREVDVTATEFVALAKIMVLTQGSVLETIQKYATPATETKIHGTATAIECAANACNVVNLIAEQQAFQNVSHAGATAQDATYHMPYSQSNIALVMPA